MKKILVYLLCCFMLCGCGSNNANKSDDNSNKQQRAKQQKEVKKTKSVKEVNNILYDATVEWLDYDVTNGFQAVNIDIEGNNLFVYLKLKEGNIDYKEDILYITYYIVSPDQSALVYDRVTNINEENFRKNNDDSINMAIEFDYFLKDAGITYKELMNWIPYVLKLNE